MTDSPNWKILVADDNVQNLELIEAFLGDLDCEVETAIDGEETLAKVESFAPDLILLDVMMPKVSGFEVCKQLKKSPETKDIPILMVTSLNEASDIERGVESGTNDFLSKPIQKQILLHRVRTLLEVRSLKDELQRTLEYVRRIEDSSRSK